MAQRMGATADDRRAAPAASRRLSLVPKGIYSGPPLPKTSPTAAGRRLLTLVKERRLSLSAAAPMIGCDRSLLGLVIHGQRVSPWLGQRLAAFDGDLDADGWVALTARSCGTCGLTVPPDRTTYCAECADPHGPRGRALQRKHSRAFWRRHHPAGRRGAAGPLTAAGAPAAPLGRIHTVVANPAVLRAVPAAIFVQACRDYLGGSPPLRRDAEAFLDSSYARYLAEHLEISIDALHKRLDAMRLGEGRLTLGLRARVR